MKVLNLNISLKLAKRLGVKEAVVLAYLQEAVRRKTYKMQGTFIIASVNELVTDIGLYSTSTMLAALNRLRSLKILEAKSLDISVNHKPFFCYGINNAELDKIK